MRQLRLLTVLLLLTGCDRVIYTGTITKVVEVDGKGDRSEIHFTDGAVVLTQRQIGTLLFNVPQQLMASHVEAIVYTLPIEADSEAKRPTVHIHKSTEGDN